jgi:ActR/RegA family two-component response regulator
MSVKIEKILMRCARKRAQHEPMPTLDQLERAHIERVLEATDGNVTHAAEVLGIHLSTLKRRLERYHQSDKRAQQAEAR